MLLHFTLQIKVFSLSLAIEQFITSPSRAGRNYYELSWSSHSSSVLTLKFAEDMIFAYLVTPHISL